MAGYLYLPTIAPVQFFWRVGFAIQLIAGKCVAAICLAASGLKMGEKVQIDWLSPYGLTT